jgi:hypothetical protein
MLENDITDVLDNTFTDEHDVFGVLETVELCPNGASIAVTEDNKKEYVRLICKHRLMRGIEDQVSSCLLCLFLCLLCLFVRCVC